MTKGDNFRLVDLNGTYQKQLMSLFDCKAEVFAWGGPNFVHPFTFESFTQSLNLSRGITKALVDVDGQFVAFGQCYERLGLCHLGRLLVVPASRGQGVVSMLVDLLFEKFNLEQETNRRFTRCSLFVLTDNQRAINAYTKQGFEVAQYPQGMPFNGMLYMVKSMVKGC